MKPTSSGHYLLPVADVIADQQKEIEVFLNENDGDKDFTEKELTRVHKCLQHPSRKVMEQMLINSGVFNKAMNMILNKIYENCDWCLKFRKALARSKVSPPMATNFNETLSMDLKIWPSKGVTILYFIDVFTRFTQAHIIPDKKPETILEKLQVHWIQNHGRKFKKTEILIF